MSSSEVYFRRIGHLLKRTSLEMRRVTSQPMSEPVDDINQPSSPKLPTDSDDFLSDWWITPPQTEFSLSDELLKGMESIVNCRQCTFATLSRILPEDPRQCKHLFLISLNKSPFLILHIHFQVKRIKFSSEFKKWRLVHWCSLHCRPRTREGGKI